MDATSKLHWLTLFDPADGEPYGVGCDCEIGRDHDGAGSPNNPLDDDAEVTP